jgi:amyloid beta precursor protein binding protein 1
MEPECGVPGDDDGGAGSMEVVEQDGGSKEQAEEERDIKYDRQLRLWGPHGQASLMSSHVLLAGAGPAGSETLKNMVLPGVGQFTVVDDRLVGERDLGNNFFVTADSVGQPRAEVVCRLLQELNPDATGNALPVSAASLPPSFLVDAEVSLVVCDLDCPATIRSLSAACWSASIPMVMTRACGLLGYVRLQFRDHCVIETRPETEQRDLRLSMPWPALREHCLSMDFEAMDSKAHSHVPMVAILVRAAESWKQAHNGALPCTFEEKSHFKQGVRRQSRDIEAELNFQEAEADAYLAYANPSLDSDSLVLQDLPVPLGPQSSDFDFLVEAVRSFVMDNGGLPPLAGEVPDMTSDTDSFVCLQQIYRAKAEEDVHAVATILGELLSSNGRSADSISREDIATFAKNVRSLYRATTGPLPLPSDDARKLAAAAEEDPYFDAPEQTPALWGVVLSAAAALQEEKGAYPGDADAEDVRERDAKELEARVRQLTPECGATMKHAAEVTRFASSQLHTTAAVLGGIASQEAIKLATRQFLPLDNFLVYNGIAGVMGAYKIY